MLHAGRTQPFELCATFAGDPYAVTPTIRHGTLCRLGRSANYLAVRAGQDVVPCAVPLRRIPPKNSCRTRARSQGGTRAPAVPACGL